MNNSLKKDILLFGHNVSKFISALFSEEMRTSGLVGKISVWSMIFTVVLHIFSVVSCFPYISTYEYGSKIIISVWKVYGVSLVFALVVTIFYYLFYYKTIIKQSHYHTVIGCLLIARAILCLVSYLLGARIFTMEYYSPFLMIQMTLLALAAGAALFQSRKIYLMMLSGAITVNIIFFFSKFQTHFTAPRRYVSWGVLMECILYATLILQVMCFTRLLKKKEANE